MGAWGTGPLDNDGAAERVTQIRDAVIVNARRHGEDATRFAAWLVSTLHNAGATAAPEDYAELVIALRRLRRDEDFINAWKDPREIASSIDRQIRSLERAMRQVQQQYATRGRPVFPGREGLGLCLREFPAPPPARSKKKKKAAAGRARRR